MLLSLIPELFAQVRQFNSQLSFGLLNRKQIVGEFDSGGIRNDEASSQRETAP
jgi:hypothetical protein